MTEGYILNAIQTATPLPVVYRSVERGNGTEDAIQEDTQLSEDQITDALSGLQLFRLIEKVGEYQAVEPSISHDSNLKEFQLSALHNIAQEAKPASDDWGKQSAVLVNFEYLVDSNTQFFDRGDSAVADNMDTFQRQLNYNPEDRKGDRNDMNDNKLTNWARTAQLLGLVRKAQGTNFTTFPNPSLIHELMYLATEELDDPSPADSEYPRIKIRDYFDWMTGNFLRISLTDDGEIPEIIGRVFEYLSRENAIRLVEAGDDPALGLENVPMPPTMDPAANSIEVR